MATFSVSNVFAQANKPNILVIMGDDIGMWNIGAYHRGMMAGKTPNLDKIAKEGMLFTDYYAEASCTAGRANFIMGELPIRTGMTTVGLAGAKTGLPAEACTIASALKADPRWALDLEATYPAFVTADVDVFRRLPSPTDPSEPRP